MNPKSIGDHYKTCAYVLDYDPESTGYKQGWYRILNMKLSEFCRLRAWRFLETKTTITARGDYTTGTASFTNGSRTVTGSGTTWTTTMEEAWIAPGSDPAPGDFVRIGRVASTTTIYLPEAYTGSTAAGSAYTIRYRYHKLPDDCLDMHALVARVQLYGKLSYVSTPTEAQVFYNEKITGKPLAFTPANPEPWQRGLVMPPTPTHAPTVSYTAAASTLTVNTVYQYCYTWVMNGVESGCSPIAEATPTGGTPTVRLTAFDRVGATEGRYIRIYRAIKNDGVFYKIADVTTTPYDDSGTANDETMVYYENSIPQHIRFYPRPGTDDTYPVELTYQQRPRDVQKDSDRLPLPPDAEQYVIYSTIAELARSKAGAAAVAAQYDRQAALALARCEKFYIDYVPNTMDRTGAIEPDFAARTQILGIPRIV
jgi:hypothetical protein